MTDEEFDSTWHSLVDVRLQKGDERMARLESALAENTTATKNIEANTKDLLEWAQTAEGARRVLEAIGKWARPIGWIMSAVAALIAVYTATKTAISGYIR